MKLRLLITILFFLPSFSYSQQWTNYGSAWTSECVESDTPTCPPPSNGAPYRQRAYNTLQCGIPGSNPPEWGTHTNYSCEWNLEPCVAPQWWDQNKQQCTNGCPPGHTEIGGECLPNYWCETLGGYISQNMECPAPDPNCENGMASCNENNQPPNQPPENNQPPYNENNPPPPGNEEGEQAGREEANRDDAINRGQQNGAGAGAVEEMNNTGGIDPTDAQAIHDTATESAGVENTTAEQVASDVFEACVSRGYDPTICRNIALGAGEGFQNGGEVAEQVWDGRNNGPQQPSTGSECTSGNCTNSVYLACPPNYVWNGSSSNPQCVPSSNPDVCYPSWQNDYCNNYALTCQNGSFWSSMYEACVFDIQVENCPSGTTLNAQTGQCESNHIQPDGNGNPSCPSGYQLTSLGCRPTTTTTTTTRTETQNPDGSVTVTETTETVGGNTSNVTNNYYGGDGTGELDILNGPCDPSADNYLECTGLVQQYDETAQQNTIDQLDSHGTQLLDNAGQSIIDGITDIETVQDDYADGIGSLLIDLYDFGNVTCNDITLTFREWSSSGGCQQTAIVRSIFAWLVSLFTIWNIFTIATRGNE